MPHLLGNHAIMTHNHTVTTFSFARGEKQKNILLFVLSPFTNKAIHHQTTTRPAFLPTHSLRVLFKRTNNNYSMVSLRSALVLSSVLTGMSRGGAASSLRRFPSTKPTCPFSRRFRYCNECSLYSLTRKYCIVLLSYLRPYFYIIYLLSWIAPSFTTPAN